MNSAKFFGDRVNLVSTNFPLLTMEARLTLFSTTFSCNARVSLVDTENHLANQLSLVDTENHLTDQLSLVDTI